jgi:phosphoglycolate phosphatase
LTALRLAVFDVDGTLVDSQAHIVAAMDTSFEEANLVPPSSGAVRRIIGLSVPQAIAQLAPDLAPARIDALVDGYKAAYVRLRAALGAEASPLYPGIAALLDRLGSRDDLLLGVATGKSRRGLDVVLDTHALAPRFVTAQVADDHPSKPHPAMLLSAVADAGVETDNAVMIGDTVFDMQMARNARVAPLAVGWGYHAAEALAAESPVGIAPDAEALERLIVTALDLPS